MTLFTTIAENLSNVVAFYLAMHNAGAHQSMQEFIDGMPKHESPFKWGKS